jgi:hypothetical protein
MCGCPESAKESVIRSNMKLVPYNRLAHILQSVACACEPGCGREIEVRGDMYQEATFQVE